MLTDIQKFQIWRWIAAVKSQYGEYPDSLHESLCALHSDERASIQEEYGQLLEQADKRIVWEAGSLIHGLPLGDDSFVYFRNWLIWSGVEVYVAGTTEPDKLLDQNVDLRNIYFEPLGECGAPKVIGIPLPKWDEKESSPATMRKNVPRLWEKFSSTFASETSPPQFLESVFIEGLGQLSLGSKVFHKAGFGEGEIVEIFGPTGLMKIKFASGVRPFSISPEFFSVLD